MKAERRLTVVDVLKQTLATQSQEPDAILLDRFARFRDEDAFAALVARHGPMVLSACRRILGDQQSSEDAFQAVFMVLARKAATLPRPDALAGWLFGVARRAALKARSVSRRPSAELTEAILPPEPGRDPLGELSGREVLAILEEELQRLPRQYRMAVVLCCLEGLTIEEAAKRLNTTPGAIRGRLERGRSRLFKCLSSRGLLPATVLAIAVTAQAAYGSTVGLRLLAVRGACQFVSSAGGAAAGAVPAASKIIAEGVLNAMMMTKLKVAGYGFLALVLAAGPAIAGGFSLGLSEKGPIEVAAVTPQPVLTDRSVVSAERTIKADDKGEKSDHRNRGKDKEGKIKHDGSVDKDGNPKLDDDYKEGDFDKDGNPKRSRGKDKDGNPKEGHGGKRDGGRDKGPKSDHV